MTTTILTGDCIEQMRTLPDASIHCCVTSPPYYGLRDYGHEGQIGLEETPGAYVAKLVDVFREVRRVLRDDGTLWLNLGDSYAATSRGGDQSTYKTTDDLRAAKSVAIFGAEKRKMQMPNGIKPKDLVGIPWRVAFALQADGWWLRQDIIWHKPNPMPESVTDRCTKAHEYVFLLSKSERYHYDAEAISEPATYAGMARGGSTNRYEQNRSGMDCKVFNTRNKRSVWSVATKPYACAHFATFPPKLIEPCILAGCPAGGTVLDPFGGSGTTAAVAVEHGRNAIICELNPKYVELARRRVAGVQPRLVV